MRRFNGAAKLENFRCKNDDGTRLRTASPCSGILYFQGPGLSFLVMEIRGLMKKSETLLFTIFMENCKLFKNHNRIVT